MAPGVEGDLVIVMQRCYRDCPLSRPECRQNFYKTKQKFHGQTCVLLPRITTSGSATRRHRPDVDTGAPVVRGPVSPARQIGRGRGAVTMELRPRPHA